MSAATVSIIISAGAVGLSIVTLVLTQIQRSLDNRRIIRQELTDVLSKITDMQIESKKSPEAMEYLAPAATAQARLAALLIDQLPSSLVNDLDYITLASVAFDPIEARQNYEKAVSAARSSYYRIMARRGYGSFLFETGDENGGAAQFTAALAELTQPGDETHARRYDLYSTWAWYDNKLGNPADAQDKAQLAQAELSQIESRAWREWYARDNNRDGDRDRQANGSAEVAPDGTETIG